MIHSGEKPFFCRHRNKRFITTSNLMAESSQHIDITRDILAVQTLYNIIDKNSVRTENRIRLLHH